MSQYRKDLLYKMLEAYLYYIFNFFYYSGNHHQNGKIILKTFVTKF